MTRKRVIYDQPRLYRTATCLCPNNPYEPQHARCPKNVPQNAFSFFPLFRNSQPPGKIIQ